MAKELIRVPRVLGESYNSVLIERLYEAGGNVMLDLIIYLGSYHLKDLFGTSWFSVEDFCRNFAPKVIGMNVFSTFDTGVMVALLLGIEFLRSDIRTILYCKRNDPRILKSCLYTLLILLTSLYSIVAGAMLHPEPVPVYELIPGFQYGVYGFSFSFILLAVACLYRKTLPFVLLGYAMIYVIGVLIPLLRYVVSMMDYFTRTRV